MQDVKNEHVISYMQINTDPSNQMCYIIEKVEPNAARIILCNSSSMQHREGRAATRSVVCVIAGIAWPVFGQTWFDARSVKSISYYLKSSAACLNWKNSRTTGNGIVAFRAVAL